MHRTKDGPVRLKLDDRSDTGEFEAIVSVFGNVDSVGDRVVPGAFAESLAAWKERPGPIPVIWSHRWDDPDAHIGIVTSAVEDDEGLRITGKLDVADNPTAARVWKLLKGRRVDSFSFAYDVVDEVKGEDGANELRTLDLLEVGPTLVGANRETRLLSAKNSADLAARLDALEQTVTTGFAKLAAIFDVAVDDATKPEPDPEVPDEVPFPEPGPRPDGGNGTEDPAGEDRDGDDVDGTATVPNRRRLLAELELAALDLDDGDELDDAVAS